MDEVLDQATIAARRRACEQLVRDQVMAETLRAMPPPSVRQRLEASHYELMSSASPAAFMSVWRR